MVGKLQNLRNLEKMFIEIWDITTCRLPMLVSVLPYELLMCVFDFDVLASYH